MAVQKITPHTLVKDRKRTDLSEHVLTTHHYLFCHEEMEIFVDEADLLRAIAFVRAAIESFAGVGGVFPAEFLPAVRDAGLEQQLTARRGSYVHHYPLFCRRILPDETMISMTAAAGGPMYSISVFTYDRPGHRDAYYAFCSFLAYSLLKLVNAKLHWGKHFPFRHADIAGLYPGLEEFRAMCLANDRDGVLRNGYSARVLNLPPGRSSR
jgi:L-gulono-1,4-lactone dehydrogenase